MLNVVIAPTRTYKRDPEQKEINDVIKDPTNAVNLEKKYDPQLPAGATQAPEDMELKRYHDMRVVSEAVPKQDDKARALFVKDEVERQRLGVVYPTTGCNEQNLKHLQGF